jgi:hypothetical protein
MSPGFLALNCREESRFEGERERHAEPMTTSAASAGELSIGWQGAARPSPCGPARGHPRCRPREAKRYTPVAVPRDVEAGVDSLDDVYRYDIDDLKQVVDANLCERAREAQRAEALVEREVSKFVARQGDGEVIPTIVSLRARLEEIRVGEVRKTLARLPDAGPETRAAIDALSTAMVNKILHAPITKLRELSRAGASRSWLELVPELFGLGRQGSGSGPAAAPWR